MRNLDFLVVVVLEVETVNLFANGSALTYLFEFAVPNAGKRGESPGSISGLARQSNGVYPLDTVVNRHRTSALRNSNEALKQPLQRRRSGGVRVGWPEGERKGEGLRRRRRGRGGEDSILAQN